MAASRTKTRLPRNDPIVVTLRKACLDRPEEDLVIRKRPIMRRKQAYLHFEVATEKSAIMSERSSANQFSHLGTPQRRRQYRTCRWRTGSHKHCPRPFPGALHTSNGKHQHGFGNGHVKSCNLFQLWTPRARVVALYFRKRTAVTGGEPHQRHLSVAMSQVGRHTTWFSSCVAWSSNPLSGKSQFLPWTAMLRRPLIISVTI